jgi:glycosyltransferase involved in cell wall biosynthesis
MRIGADLNWPRISVVMPSFNQARYLGEALQSVVGQGYPNLELIVIDGGSTDGSVEVIKRYEEHIAYWVSEPDGGQTRGLIKGFERATGEIQGWLNSDDLFETGVLFDVADYLGAHPDTDAVFGDALWIDAEGRVLRPQREIPFNRFIWTYTYNYIPCVSMYWRKGIYEKVGGLDPEFDLAMDADLWIRFADIGRIGHVRRIWSRLRFYPEQKNCRLRDRSDLEHLRIRSRYWGTERPSLLGARRLVAQSCRICWRLLTGCYSPGYRRYLERT